MTLRDFLAANHIHPNTLLDTELATRDMTKGATVNVETESIGVGGQGVINITATIDIGADKGKASLRA